MNSLEEVSLRMAPLVRAAAHTDWGVVGHIWWVVRIEQYLVLFLEGTG